MNFLSILFGRPKLASTKVDPLDEKPEPKQEKPKKLEQVPIATRLNHRKSGRAKYDPLYLKKAVQACRAARQRMGIE